jgi:lipoyl(octanoyl) transferase
MLLRCAPTLLATPLPYPVALELLAEAAAAVAKGAPERLYFCEHPALLTLGSSANPAEAAGPHGLPIFPSTRGGQVTYHGPGQRLIYPVVRLDDRWGHDIRHYMYWLQTQVQQACTQLGVVSELRRGAELGLWVQGAKLAAFGVRVRQGVAFHGAALNVMNDLNIYHQFTPCGLAGSRATRLMDHSPGITFPAVDAALRVALCGNHE